MGDEEQERLAREEQERLAREAGTRRNVERYRQEYGSLTDEEVVAELVAMPDHVIAPAVMTHRLNTSIGELRKALRRAEILTWALVLLTVALLALTAVLALRTSDHADRDRDRDRHARREAAFPAPERDEARFIRRASWGGEKPG